MAEDHPELQRTGIPAIRITLMFIPLVLATAGGIPRSRQLFEQLRAAPGERIFEARLSRFHWRPLRVFRGDGLGPQAEQIEIASRLLANANHTPQGYRDAAAAALLLNEPDRAIALITAIPETDRDAAEWSDLAAALLTRSAKRSFMDDVVEALGASDVALELASNLPEARFNRALAIERLGLRVQAAAAWSDYVHLHSSDGWSNEALSHLTALTANTASFDGAFHKDDPDLAIGNQQAATRIVAAYPGETRDRLIEMLSEYIKHSHDAASRHQLVAAQALARELASRGDPFMIDYIAQIESSDEKQNQTLATAQTAFTDGRRLLKEKQPTAAEVRFRTSEQLFGSISEPMSLLARRHTATCLYELNRIDDARRELEALLPGLLPQYRTERAEALWQLGMCHGAKSNWGSSIEALSDSLALYEQVGDGYNAAVVRYILAQVYDALGDADTGWKLRSKALPLLGRSTSVRTQTCLSSISRQAAVGKRWRVSASILNLEIEMANHLSDPPSHADALLRRAVAWHFIGRPEAALRDLQTADAIIDSMKDGAYNIRARADEFAVESLMATTPTEAVQKLTAAIDFHEIGGRRMYLPTLYLQRGRALRQAGDRLRANRDFETGIRELERTRETLPDITTRLGIFDAAEELFAETVEDALQRGDARRALELVERARARTLIDSITAIPASGPDPSTAIIDLFALGKRVIGFLITSESVELYEVPLAPPELARHADSLRSSLINERVLEVNLLTRDLYKALIAPIERRIAGKERLVFVPDRYSASIPFAALTNLEGRHLIEVHTVITSPSAAVYLRLQHKTNTGVRRRVLLVAAPSQDSSEPLRAVDAEYRAIAKSYPAVDFLVGADAKPRAFLRMAPNADAIHFAGHAIRGGASKQPSLLFSSSAEISRAQVEKLVLPHTEVVVLAACDTASGKITWTEGPLSMARAFLAAGAPSVIAALTPISDQESAEFFPHLHQRLAVGVAPAIALRDTQRDWLKTRPDSLLWASVQIIGQ
jgi:CHAT domain-containing protein